VTKELQPEEYRALAEFRYHIRSFLHFSETAAREEGLEPQQHQALLAIRAWDDTAGPTIGDLAARLLVQHHSAVGLVDRLANRGLVERAHGAGDRRQVQVLLTPAGEQTLARLSAQHRDELRTTGRVLVAALGALLETDNRPTETNV
jgi:DNA-binding MarR family transcriptional regulator